MEFGTHLKCWRETSCISGLFSPFLPTEMPEGPSVRKYHHLVSGFVGQQVIKTGGSSKMLNPASFQSLWLQDTQVSSSSTCGLAHNLTQAGSLHQHILCLP